MHAKSFGANDEQWNENGRKEPTRKKAAFCLWESFSVRTKEHTSHFIEPYLWYLISNAYFFFSFSNIFTLLICFCAYTTSMRAFIACLLCRHFKLTNKCHQAVSIIVNTISIRWHVARSGRGWATIERRTNRYNEPDNFYQYRKVMSVLFGIHLRHLMHEINNKFQRRDAIVSWIFFGRIYIVRWLLFICWTQLNTCAQFDFRWNIQQTDIKIVHVFAPKTRSWNWQFCVFCGSLFIFIFSSTSEAFLHNTWQMIVLSILQLTSCNISLISSPLLPLSSFPKHLLLFACCKILSFCWFTTISFWLHQSDGSWRQTVVPYIKTPVHHSLVPFDIWPAYSIFIGN